jgi:chemotaxis protein CheD
MKRINVGIGDYAVTQGRNILSTILGSCVGVILYDKVHKIGGLAHIYLPDSNRRKTNADKENDNLLSHALKYADVLVPRLLEEMLSHGAEKRYCIAYIVGGASIYEFPKDSILNIGLRNLEKTREILEGLDLRFMEVKVGGKSGRRVSFDLVTGDIEVIEFNSGI